MRFLLDISYMMAQTAAYSLEFLNIWRQLIVLDAALDLDLVSYKQREHPRSELTVSIDACKKLRASRPTQTLSIEKSPPRIIEPPP